MNRKIGEVPFSSKVWLKRYVDSDKWNDIREDQLIWDMKTYFPNEWEYKIYLMREGKMSVFTKYAEYMWLEDSAYQDEL